MRIKLILDYFNYLATAKTKHGIHSPFAFHLLTQVFQDKKKQAAYASIEASRKQLLCSNKMIRVTDLGAGSRHIASVDRAVKDIARYALKNRKYAQLLFRLVRHFQPQTMLELGTSLGISTLYQAAGNNLASLVTMEGCPETAAIAKELFKQHGCRNITLVTGNFDSELSPQLHRLKKVDYVFFDGNHRKEATLRYFETCLPFVTNDTLFVFDDIHWSDEMNEAWEHIKAHTKVTVTIDLFFLGLVFFREEQAKQHFKIRF